jgi:predicted SprT family Zn-dependent metalloprotease
MTKAQAKVLREKWKVRAGILTCSHHYVSLERAKPKRAAKNYLCLDCGADIVRKVVPSSPLP